MYRTEAGEQGSEPFTPAAEATPPRIDLGTDGEIEPQFLVNRELSWLEFNARVLDEAQDPSVPLLERLRFLSIFASNLDEFFMVRYAGVWRQIDAGVETPGRDGLTPRRVLDAITRRVQELMAVQDTVLAELLPALENEGIKILRSKDLDARQKSFLAEYFNNTLLPIVTPMAIDPGHPFPYLANRSLCLVTELEPQEQWGIPMPQTCFVHIPSSGVPRFIRVPTTPELYHFVLLEDVMRMHMDRLFSGCKIKGCVTIRVTRDAELEIHDDQADLLQTIEEALRQRRMGAAVRFQYEPGLSPTMLHLLTKEMELDPADLYVTRSFMATSDLIQLVHQVDLPHLKEKPALPQAVPAFDTAADMFSAIRNGDILLHHPYQDFEYVVRFIQNAATDPDVLAIKMTLYRVSGNSPIARALTTAARNGKEVAVLVELRARFNEEANIAWARRLEATGAHVIYGIAGFKTHCKAALIVRRESDGLRRYCHLATGNYNDQTARAYTDLGLFTCRRTFGEDLTHLFNLLTGYARPPEFHHLLLCPTSLRQALIQKLRREAEHARNGRPGRVILKMNGLSDPTLIKELYRTSQEGVHIDMLVRGICCLRPGVPGLSENIRVVSLVDRFLEHARIFYFANDGDPEFLLSSADWMSRNLDGRIEIGWPILSPTLQQELMEILEVQLADNTKGRVLKEDSTSIRQPISDTPVRAQERLIEIATEKARRPKIV